VSAVDGINDHIILCDVNEVTLRRARLVLGWVTVDGRVNHLGM